MSRVDWGIRVVIPLTSSSIKTLMSLTVAVNDMKMTHAEVLPQKFELLGGKAQHFGIKLKILISKSKFQDGERNRTNQIIFQ